MSHVDLGLDVDFAWHEMRGTAILTVRRLDPRATHLVLDTRGLEISGVAQLSRPVLGATEKLAPFWVSRPFHLGPNDPADGAPLIIDLPASNGPEESIRIEYQTAPRGLGLHWTTIRPHGRGGRLFYALSEPFGARSWIPLQDSPRARMSFRIHVHTPSDMVALLSGARDLGAKNAAAPTDRRTADHWLVVARPMAASRLDLVVGDLKFAAIGPRSGAYAAGWSARGPARELRAFEAVDAAAEHLLGRSGGLRRDFVVMPADFPFAFAAAPRLTLLSPTLFDAGPRLVPLAARLPFADAEDLIAPAGRRDRWIGQAFAAYLQSRIAARLYGAPAAAVADTLAFLELRATLAASPKSAQALDAEPLARASGAGFAAIPYEKGRLFLRYLAASVGRDRFDAFMRRCFARFAGHRLTTAQFEHFLAQHLLGGQPGAVRASDLDAWIHDPGLPQQAVLPEAAPLQAVDAARTAWLAHRATAAGIRAQHWPAEEWRYFLQGLPPRIGAARLAELDAAYAPMRSGDARRESLWLQLSIRNDYRPGIDAIARYLESVGRIGLIAPLYAELMHSATGARLARHVYSAARPGYDPLAAALIDTIVKPRAGDAPP